MSKNIVSLFALAAVIASSNVRADDTAKFQDRATNAGQILNALMTAAPDRNAPMALLHDSTCVVVIPNVVKLAFVGGGRLGYGLGACRTATGWSEPVYYKLAGGSVGWQIGVDSADIVLFFTNEEAITLLSKADFDLGGDATIAAGPVGRDVSGETDYKALAAILSYSRTRGVFAGISIQGSVLRPDMDANQTVYKTAPFDAGHSLITVSDPTTPAAVAGFLSVLNALGQ